jgi:hypothetical protein
MNEAEKEYWWKSQKERGQSKDPDVGGWILLKWILERMRW